MKLFFQPDNFEDTLENRLRLFKEHRKLAKFLKEPKDNCLVFFGKHKRPHHIGFYQKGYIFHSIEEFGVVAEKLEDLKIRYQTIEFVEYKNE